MALTNKETLKKILQSVEIPAQNIFNEKIKLVLFDKSQLEHTNIDDGSEVVKIIRQNIPSPDSNNPITLNGTTDFQLMNPKIVWDTVVVADDLALTTVYIENHDYIIDYENGLISRTTVGGSIPDGGQVFIWFIPFVVLQAGNDYNIDHDAGTITRRAATSIPNSTILYIDYSHAQITITDDALDEIIEEMEAYIEPRLKPSFNLNSDNKGLKAAATNFCLYLLCLSSALKELHIAAKTTSDDIAKQWQTLSDKYLKTANTMFSKYFSTSTQAIGGLIQNRYTKSRIQTQISPAIPIRTRRH